MKALDQIFEYAEKAAGIDKSQQARCYDVTIRRNPDDVVGERIRKFVQDYCKHWVYAPQVGDVNEYPHWQCRFSLKSRLRLGAALLFFHEFFPDAHIEQTQSEKGRNPQTPEYYRYCSDKRTLAPRGRIWTDKDRDVDEMLHEVMRPWQRDVLSLPKDDRSIYVIYDPVGNTGKSWFVRYLKYNCLGDLVPPMSSKDVMRRTLVLMKQGFRGFICVDLPRAYKNTYEYRDMFTSLETLKSGYAYDDRYSWDDSWFSPINLQLVVFCNTLPNPNWLSYDRWRCYDITQDGLKKFDLYTRYEEIQHEKEVSAGLGVKDRVSAKRYK